MLPSLYDLVRWKRRIHNRIFVSLLKKQFNSIGKNCTIHPTLSYKNPNKIYLSDDCTIKEGAILDGRSDHDIGIYLGKGVTVRAYTYIDCYGGEGYVYLDDYASIGQQVIIGGNGGVRIGKYGMVSGLTYIVSASRIYDKTSQYPYNFQGEIRKPVILEDNTWIASHCMILSGVTIGKNSVVGAGSVVTEDIPPSCLAFGVPAIVKRELTGNEFQDVKTDQIHQYLSEKELEEISKEYRNIIKRSSTISPITKESK